MQRGQHLSQYALRQGVVRTREQISEVGALVFVEHCPNDHFGRVKEFESFLVLPEAGDSFTDAK